MIIFYNKNTGKIEGTIDGRVHHASHLKMWIGDSKETERIIINWIQDKKTKNYIPEHEQKDLFIKLDKRQIRIKNYKVDVKTKKIVKK